MASQIHVFNRSGTCYFRGRVPKDLLSLYLSSQIIFGLKTKNRKEAVGRPCLGLHLLCGSQ
jgi:hypothetical protein